ncbi:MAG: hypothetical protein JWR38_2679 [Mucilaginibacter sp.]|nr:hypothetical protein [Mucilaginibacter sp.]
MKEIQTQKFYWLKYEVSAIQALINNFPDIDRFVFCYFFPNSTSESKPLQLIAYGYTPPPTNAYTSYFDTLDVYNYNALELSGPIIMSNNIISKANILLLINTPDPNGDKPDYLVFIPNVTGGHVYYDIKRFKRTDTGDVQLGDPGSINTDPSPPATING